MGLSLVPPPTSLTFVPGAAWFCVSFTQQECSALHRTGLFPQLTLKDWVAVVVLLFLIPVCANSWTVRAWYTEWPHQVNEGVVPVISHYVPPPFESFCLLTGYLKWFRLFHWTATKSKHNCRWELPVCKRSHAQGKVPRKGQPPLTALCAFLPPRAPAGACASSSCSQSCGLSAFRWPVSCDSPSLSFRAHLVISYSLCLPAHFQK